MKKSIILSLSLISTLTNAHYMAPVNWGGRDQLDSITTSGWVFVPVTVGTDSEKDFEIFLDGELISFLTIPKNKTKTSKIPIKLSTQNEVEYHKICSVGYGTTFNTQICTVVKAYWLQQ